MSTNNLDFASASKVKQLMKLRDRLSEIRPVEKKKLSLENLSLSFTSLESNDAIPLQNQDELLQLWITVKTIIKEIMEENHSESTASSSHSMNQQGPKSISVEDLLKDIIALFLLCCCKVKNK